MNNSWIRTMALALALAGAQTLAGAEVDTKPAVKAADAWLTLVDKGQYKKSWDGAASYFKGNVTADRWQTQIKGVRAPLGKVLSRKVKSMQYTTSVPGAPDGEYVIVQYDTSFEKKASAVETVTPQKDKGTWKVCGYYIR